MGKVEKEWNVEVEQIVDSLTEAKAWLKGYLKNPEKNEFDWASEKSAHTALKYLELAEYEIWSLMYWENEKQVHLDQIAGETIA